MVIIMLKRDPVDKLLAGNPLTIFTSYRNQSIYFSAHQPTGFYMMRILIANELIVASINVCNYAEPIITTKYKQIADELFIRLFKRFWNVLNLCEDRLLLESTLSLFAI